MSAALTTEIITPSRFTITVHVMVQQQLSSSSVTPLLQQCCPMETSLEDTVLKQTCFWCNLKISFEFNYVLDDSIICLLWTPFVYAQNWSVIVFAGLCPVPTCNEGSEMMGIQTVSPSRRLEMYTEAEIPYQPNEPKCHNSKKIPDDCNIIADCATNDDIRRIKLSF